MFKFDKNLNAKLTKFSLKKGITVGAIALMTLGVGGFALQQNENANTNVHADSYIPKGMTPISKKDIAPMSKEELYDLQKGSLSKKEYEKRQNAGKFTTKSHTIMNKKIKKRVNKLHHVQKKLSHENRTLHNYHKSAKHSSYIRKYILNIRIHDLNKQIKLLNKKINALSAELNIY